MVPWEALANIDPMYYKPLWVLLSFGIYVVLRLSVNRGLKRTIKDDDLRFRLKKSALYVLNGLLLVVLFQLLAGDSWSAASFLGLLSAGIAFVFREPILNLAGWLFILSRKPFSLGDRVQVGTGQAGDVIDIGLHDFSLIEIGNWVDADQSTGRVLHIPNSVVFTQNIANYQQGFPYLWHEIEVPITYQSDWRKARDILKDLAFEKTVEIRKEQSEVIERLSQSSDYLIRFKHLTPIVYLKKSDYALVLTVRFCVCPRERRSCESEFWEGILDAFAQAEGVELAYPTQVISLSSADGSDRNLPTTAASTT